MRKLLLILFLGLGFCLHGQVVSSSVWFSTTGGVVGVDSANWEAEFKAVYYAMADPPVIDTADMFNTWVENRKDGGYWTGSTDLIYVLCVKNEEDAKINWIDPTAGTFDLVETGAGSVSFTPYEGFTSDGTNVLDSQFELSSDGTNIEQDSLTLGVYIRNNTTNAQPVMGVDYSINHDTEITPRNASNNFEYRINSNQGGIVGGITDSGGGWHATRTAAGAIEGYHEGVSVDTDTDASTGLPSGSNLCVLGSRLTSVTDSQVSLAYLMEGISDTDASNLNAIDETLMDALGKGVQ